MTDHIDDTSPHPRDDAGQPAEPDETQATELQTIQPAEGSPAPQKERKAPGRFGLVVRWVGLGIVLFIAIVGLAAFGGVQVGTGQSNQEATLAAAVDAATQYQLGQQDLENGRCDFARLRFEFIINKLDPSYPGAGDALASALLCIGLTVTPTNAPPPTITPTPDSRSTDELFAAAQALLVARDWDALLPVLDSLRLKDPAYRTVDVDGMYYVAYRNRGDQRILVEGNLEGGIFDLNRAEQYGPLDVEAVSHRDWANLYVNGVSFWELDWGQVVYYFSLLVPVAPNLWDGTMYAVDRLATAQVNYVADLIAQADYLLTLKGWCDAWALYEQASTYAPLDPAVQPTAAYAYEKCVLNPEEEPRTPTPVP